MSEAAHGLQSERSSTGEALSRVYRGAEASGWFSYELSTGSADDPLFLVCHLDGGRWGPEPEGVMDVFVGGNMLLRLDFADRVVSRRGVYFVSCFARVAKRPYNVNIEAKFEAS